MDKAVRVRLDEALYDEAAVRRTVARFAEAVDATATRRGGRLVVTVTAAADEVDAIAGELLNIALAETLEARADAGS